MTDLAQLDLERPDDFEAGTKNIGFQYVSSIQVNAGDSSATLQIDALEITGLGADVLSYYTLALSKYPEKNVLDVFVNNNHLLVVRDVTTSSGIRIYATPDDEVDLHERNLLSQIAKQSQFGHYSIIQVTANPTGAYNKYKAALGNFRRLGYGAFIKSN